MINNKEEYKRLERLILDTEKTIKILEEKHTELNELIIRQCVYLSRLKNELEQISYKLCQHRYSRSINQQYPRLCIDCGEVEERKDSNIDEHIIIRKQQ
jgi:predicted RNase H-like nuclease (RuvC/YqgF family)